MQLTATITRDELHALLEQATPLRIDLGRGRSASFGLPQSLELVPGLGVRARGSAKVVWDLAGVPLPVSLRKWQVLLVPAVNARELALEPRLEAFDLGRVPGFFDDRILDTINESLEAQKGRLSWDIGRLALNRVLPARMTPRSAFHLAPVSADVRVGENELTIALQLRAQIARVREAAVAAPAPPSLRTG